jgi:hypothetical protein
MRLPRIPDIADLGARRPLILLALLVTLVVAVMLGVRDGHDLRLGYGDTDDAMRVVLARQLVHGRGWWDQKELVLQPPVGVYLHWSRLLDGGIALMERVFAWFVSWPDAETATRFLWPVLWIFPAAVATLLAARRLGDRTAAPHWALLIGALVLMLHLPLYNQFRPGRVDHHDAQIVFFLLAFAGAVQTGPLRWGPILAGVASGLGIAVGLEALVFQVLIGAALALKFTVAGPEDRTTEARRMSLYGLALFATTSLAFLIQTPPWRWSVVGCDALAFNLAAGIAVVGIGLAAVAGLTRDRVPWVRVAALGGLGAIAAAVYLGLDHNCLHGPFADVDPRVKPFWLDYVQEVAPWPGLFKRHPDDAIAVAAPAVLGLFAWLWLGRHRTARGDFGWRLTGVLLLTTSVAGFAMVRAATYAAWVAVPLIAAAAGDIAWRYRRMGVIAPIVAALIFTPMAAIGVALSVEKLWGNLKVAITHKPPPKPAPKQPEDYCFNASSYRELAAARPIGLTAGDIDLGPHVLALTPHATLSAPYHRMNWGIMAARGIMIADADDKGPNGAEARARALGVTYILECSRHQGDADRTGIGANSLQAVLDRHDWPDWLTLISNETSPIQVFRVQPLAPPGAPK